MLNTQINRIACKRIATALGELNAQVVYVGGAVVSLYIDDLAAEDIRPTKDVDITFEIATIGELEELRNNLISKGFTQSHEDDVVCRFRYDDIKVDVMATKNIAWAPANSWFLHGFKKSETIKLDDVEIKILPFTYFLATKFEAHSSRGGSDARFSHDFEDIVYLLNHTSNFRELIISSDKTVQEFIKSEFGKICANDHLKEAIIAHLFHENQIERYDRIISLLKVIIENS